MSKKTEGIVAAYNAFIATDISQLYANPSDAKKAAYNHHKTVCGVRKGYQLRVGFATPHFFSLGYLYEHNNQTYLHYETGRNLYDIPVRKTYLMGDGSYHIEPLQQP